MTEKLLLIISGRPGISRLRPLRPQGIHAMAAAVTPKHSQLVIAESGELAVSAAGVRIFAAWYRRSLAEAPFDKPRFPSLPQLRCKPVPGGHFRRQSCDRCRADHPTPRLSGQCSADRSLRRSCSIIFLVASARSRLQSERSTDRPQFSVPVVPAASLRMVFRKFLPRAPYTHDVRNIRQFPPTASTACSPLSLLAPYS